MRLSWLIRYNTAELRAAHSPSHVVMVDGLHALPSKANVANAPSQSIRLPSGALGRREAVTAGTMCQGGWLIAILLGDPGADGTRKPNTVPEHNWSSIVARAVAGQMDIHEVACLAERLASSGATISPRTTPTADLASTGGPTSLSTILCPPMLASAGWEVPKLGVPGRPAGGIDVLGSVEGYQVALASKEATRVLDACGFRWRLRQPSSVTSTSRCRLPEAFMVLPSWGVGVVRYHFVEF